MRLPDDNPFATESRLPFALPPFADLREEHVLPAFAAGCAEQLAQVRAIVESPEPATFTNTVAALEGSGRLLSRVILVASNLVAADATPERQRIEAETVPRYAAHLDAIRLDPRLFARVDAVHATRHEAGLTAEQVRLVERIHADLVLAGAGLDDADRARLAELNTELASLETTFSQQLRSDTEARAVLLDSVDQLAGASPDAVAAAAAAAAARGHQGRWLVALVLPTAQPLLAQLTDRQVRRRLFEASVGRATGDVDNRPVAARLAALRAQAAGLLGFASHAHRVTADQTARTPEAVDELLGRLVAPAVANARREAQLLAEYAARDGIAELAPWDWAFYSARVAAERYHVDPAALRPYFELDRVLHEGVFRAAGLLYGVTFERRAELAAYHPDVRVWQVREADGTPIGLYLGDFHARDSKRGGAWMSSFVRQNHLFGDRPVVVNNLNIPKPPAGQPCLLTLDEVDTLFHEFGHTLHGLFSDVTYPRLAGTSVPRDVVEFPSQVNEVWAQWPDLLAGYAVHHETGEPLAAEQIERIRAAQQWGQGFRTVEYLAATLLDQAWHRLAPGTVVDDADEFERRALAEAGVAEPLIPPRYRTAYFQHIFGGAYAAGYYSYIWAEVLDADACEWFTEHGPVRAAGDAYRREILSRGGSVDLLDAFAALVGRAPDIEPLLRRRGLLPA